MTNHSPSVLLTLLVGSSYSRITYIVLVQTLNHAQSMTIQISIFTSRCTVRDARSCDRMFSVYLSVCLSVRPFICNVGRL